MNNAKIKARTGIEFMAKLGLKSEDIIGTLRKFCADNFRRNHH